MNHSPISTVLRSASCIALVSGPTSASGGDPLPFDLHEISEVGSEAYPGIDFQRHPVSVYAAEAGGIATVDFDNDGWIDILFSDTEGHPNHLYRNRGDGTFSEEAAERGVAELAKRRGSVLFFDMENDGDLDLLSCGYPSQSIPNFDLYSLYRNNGEPEYDFSDVTASAGGFPLAFLPEPTLIGEPGGVTCGDVTGSGFLDVFVTYWNRSFGYYFDQPRLWINASNPAPADEGQADYSSRIFSDETEAAGLSGPVDGWIWTPTFMDFDRDGDLDLHVNIDHGFDVLRLNDGTGVFGPNICLEVGMDGDPPEIRSEMGIAIADIDFDTLADTYQTNWLVNDRLYMNRSEFEAEGGSGLAFEDVAPETGTDVCTFGWGTAFVDLDNDLDLDLLAVTSMAVGFENWFHENRWPELEAGGTAPNFVERSAELADWHLPGGAGDLSRNLAPFDYDNDGDVDVLVGRFGESGFVTVGIRPKAGFFENTLSSGAHWLEVDLVEYASSRNTVGARLYVRAGGVIQTRTIYGAGTSFLTQLPYRQHFGLGDADTVDWACVRWFDGSHDVFLDPGVDEVVQLERTVKEPTGDMNGDGVVSQVDVNLLFAAVRRPAAYDNVYGWWPWQVLGDLDGNGFVELADVALLQALLL